MTSQSPSNDNLETPEVTRSLMEASTNTTQSLKPVSEQDLLVASRMTGADTGVHENTLDQTGENSGGRGGSVTAGEAGMQGHAADDAAGIRGQPRGGGGGRVTAGGAGLQGNADQLR